MVFLSKISSQGDANSVFEPRNPSVKCISAFSAQTQHFVRVGCQHGPMLTSKIPENRGPGGVWASLGRSWGRLGGYLGVSGSVSGRLKQGAADLSGF